jgi:23S rRNA (pseudouridine1915-N3)-methyltransferase
VKILLLAVGRLKEAHWREAQDEYVKRLKRYAPLEIKEVKDDAALVAAVPPRAHLVLLDERGDNWSSEDIARKLIAAEESHGGGAPLVFAIGGADGLPAELKAKAVRTLAFGKATLPHRLARIVLLEQIYRAYTILRGEPYHHA